MYPRTFPNASTLITPSPTTFQKLINHPRKFSRLFEPLPESPQLHPYVLHFPLLTSYKPLTQTSYQHPTELRSLRSRNLRQLSPLTTSHITTPTTRTTVSKSTKLISTSQTQTPLPPLQAVVVIDARAPARTNPRLSPLRNNRHPPSPIPLNLSLLTLQSPNLSPEILPHEKTLQRIQRRPQPCLQRKSPITDARSGEARVLPE
jgi:hypothetical protein